MAKMLVYEEYRQYRKQLKEFEQFINPHPSKEEREQLKQAYLKAREKHETPNIPT
jgi:hypothetical protein